MAHEKSLSDYLKSLPDDVARAQFAKRCGTKPEYLRQVAAGHRAGSTKLAKKVEDETGGVVPKHRMRPDVYDPPKASQNVEAVA